MCFDVKILFMSLLLAIDTSFHGVNRGLLGWRAGGSYFLLIFLVLRVTTELPEPGPEGSWGGEQGLGELIVWLNKCVDTLI